MREEPAPPAEPDAPVNGHSLFCSPFTAECYIGGRVRTREFKFQERVRQMVAELARYEPERISTGTFELDVIKAIKGINAVWFGLSDEYRILVLAEIDKSEELLFKGVRNIRLHVAKIFAPYAYAPPPPVLSDVLAVESDVLARIKHEATSIKFKIHLIDKEICIVEQDHANFRGMVLDYLPEIRAAGFCQDPGEPWIIVIGSRFTDRGYRQRVSEFCKDVESMPAFTLNTGVIRGGFCELDSRYGVYFTVDIDTPILSVLINAFQDAFSVSIPSFRKIVFAVKLRAPVQSVL